MQIGQSFIECDLMSAREYLLHANPGNPRDNLEELRQIMYLCQDAQLVENYVFDWIDQYGDNNGVATKMLHLMLNHPTGQFSISDAEWILKDPHVMIKYAEYFLGQIFNEVVILLFKKRQGAKLLKGDLVLIDPNVKVQDYPTIYKEYMRAEGSCRFAVKAVTEADLIQNKYTVKDMVIPVCGWDVLWPQNDAGKIIDEVLAKHDITHKEWFNCSIRYQS